MLLISTSGALVINCNFNCFHMVISHSFLLFLHYAFVILAVKMYINHFKGYREFSNSFWRTLFPGPFPNPREKGPGNEVAFRNFRAMYCCTLYFSPGPDGVQKYALYISSLPLARILVALGG